MTDEYDMEIDRIRAALMGDDMEMNSMYASELNSIHPQGVKSAFPEPVAARSSVPSRGTSAFGPKTTHRFSTDSDDRSICILNLPRGAAGQHLTTTEELVKHFEDCGKILTCTLIRKRGTEELAGRAYIEFETHTGCGRAIDTKNNGIFYGQILTVC